MGFRFDAVTIDQGDTIDSAIWSGYTSGDDDPHLDIWGDDVDDSPVFAGPPGADIENRYTGSRTTATVAWSAVNIGLGAYKASSDLKTIVQEIVDRGSWSSGNGLCLIFWGRTDIDGRTLKVFAWDNGSNEPKLDIDYTAGGATDQDISWQGDNVHLPPREPLEVIAY